MNISEKAINDLTNQLDNLNFNLEELNRALNRTDDFNNWGYAESLASIANALVKANSLEKNRQSQNGKDLLRQVTEKIEWLMKEYDLDRDDAERLFFEMN